MHGRIETERLYIEPLTQNDSKFIQNLLNSPGWLKYIGDRNIKDENDAKNYIQKILDNKSCTYTIIKLKETIQAIGIITLIHRENQRYPDIGFALLPAYEKKGYVYEATKKYISEISKSKKIEKILGITLPNNISSIKLLEKLGLTFQKKFTQKNEELLLYCMNLR